MFEYDIERCTRRCAQTQEPLLPGQVCYSVVKEEAAEWIRLDYCQDAWPDVVKNWPSPDTAPDDVMAWWKSELPDSSAKREKWAPNDAMVNMFVELSETTQEDFRYVLCLLLIRRRVFRLEEIKKEPGNDQAEVMTVYCSKTEQEYRVTVQHPSESRIDEIQQRIANLFFESSDGSSTPLDEDSENAVAAGSETEDAARQTKTD